MGHWVGKYRTHVGGARQKRGVPGPAAELPLRTRAGYATLRTRWEWRHVTGDDESVVRYFRRTRLSVGPGAVVPHPAPDGAEVALPEQPHEHSPAAGRAGGGLSHYRYICNSKPGLPEKTQLRIGRGGHERLRPRRLLAPSAEVGVESPGHDGRSARLAVNADVVGTVSGSVVSGSLGREPRGKNEIFTVPCPQPVSQRPAVHQSRPVGASGSSMLLAASPAGPISDSGCALAPAGHLEAVAAYACIGDHFRGSPR